MPTYDYLCAACGHAFEEFQTMSEPVLTKCPKCGKRRLRRLFGTGAGIIFKGSGFYETDYKKKTGGGGDKGSDGESGKADPKPESKDGGGSGSKDDGKPEAKSESKPEAKSSESSGSKSPSSTSGGSAKSGRKGGKGK